MKNIPDPPFPLYSKPGAIQSPPTLPTTKSTKNSTTPTFESSATSSEDAVSDSTTKSTNSSTAKKSNFPKITGKEMLTSRLLMTILKKIAVKRTALKIKSKSQTKFRDNN